MAFTGSTCAYDPATHTATLVQNAPDTQYEMQITRSGDDIVFRDVTGSDPYHLCAGATVLNTDRLNIVGGNRTSVHIDESSGRLAPGFTPEPTGMSAIAIAISSTGDPSHLTVTGTRTADNNIRVTGGAAGDVDLDGDGDVDITQTHAGHVTLNGGNGDDFLSGRGTARPGVLGSVSTTLPLTVFGGSGADILEGGKALADELSGGDGSDILNSIDGRVDYLKGGGGFDLANADSVDRADDVIESRTNQ
jgi:hypothetical protein